MFVYYLDCLNGYASTMITMTILEVRLCKAFTPMPSFESIHRVANICKWIDPYVTMEGVRTCKFFHFKFCLLEGESGFIFIKLIKLNSRLVLFIIIKSLYKMKFVRNFVFV